VLLTPPKIASECGVEVAKVHAWIRSGELKAINLAEKIGGRPRWKVEPAEWEAFKGRRATTPPMVRARRGRAGFAPKFFASPRTPQSK